MFNRTIRKAHIRENNYRVFETRIIQVILFVLLSVFLLSSCGLFGSSNNNKRDYENESIANQIELGKEVKFGDITVSVSEFSFERYNDSTVTCIVTATVTNYTTERVSIDDYVFRLRYKKEYEYLQYGSYSDLTREILPLESATLKLKYQVPNIIRDDENGRLVFIITKNKLSEQQYRFWVLRDNNSQ